METLKFKIKGVVPMLMHNGQLASPLNYYAKEIKKISGKRKKTEEDHENMALLEARGGLYYDDDLGVYVPGENIEATLVSAAKLQKLGTTFKRGARIIEPKCPLIYDGPQDAEKLVKNPDFTHSAIVKVGMARILRTRPKFDDWSLEFTVGYFPDQLDKDTIIRIVEDAGDLIGLNDWRPRFGLFQMMEDAA